MLLATTANASTELSGSGEFFNVDEEVTLNLDIDHRAEFDGWQYVVEGDIYYAEENSTKVFTHSLNLTKTLVKKHIC